MGPTRLLRLGGTAPPAPPVREAGSSGLDRRSSSWDPPSIAPSRPLAPPRPDRGAARGPRWGPPTPEPAPIVAAPDPGWAPPGAAHPWGPPLGLPVSMRVLSPWPAPTARSAAAGSVELAAPWDPGRAASMSTIEPVHELRAPDRASTEPLSWAVPSIAAVPVARPPVSRPVREIATPASAEPQLLPPPSAADVVLADRDRVARLPSLSSGSGAVVRTAVAAALAIAVLAIALVVGLR
ncbi:hypothetical protein [Ilumatobacter sp.]|uniref:hypothetical protein n=1 Tax=Ilumatobacter sp. TaxID=1967498 RepID=UPI003B527B86